MSSTDFLSIRQISREKIMRDTEKVEGAMAHTVSASNSHLSKPTEGCL